MRVFVDAALPFTLFHEVQRFRQWYVVAILAVVTGLQWWAKGARSTRTAGAECSSFSMTGPAFSSAPNDPRS